MNLSSVGNTNCTLCLELNARLLMAECGLLNADFCQLSVPHNPFAVFDLEAANGIWQLQLVALFEQSFLQLIVHQRNRNSEIADFELRGLKRRVSIFGSEVSLEADPNVFS